MSFKPNTTVYLCSGTGLDASNAVWWHRFAYPKSTIERDDTWWNACFQWVKAHSVAEGYWYMTNIYKPNGYIDVGRTPYQTSKQWGESGLGSSAKQSELDNPYIYYADALTAVDYLCFSNGVEEAGSFTSDVVYAFVTDIKSLNNNTARVFYEVDAIMTYQKFFHFGQSFIERDMEFQERKDSVDGVPNWSNYNLQPEPIRPDESQYIFQDYTSTEENFDKFTLGAYDTLYVTSDVDLSAEDKITPNTAYQGIPAFQASKSSKLGDVELGIGVYYVYDRKNAVFEKLGSFNAFEHILNSYVIPHNLITAHPTPALPAFTANCDNDVADYYKGSTLITLSMPKSYNDLVGITNQAPVDGFQPVNLKTNFAPYTYFSISDKQGSSVEVPLSSLRQTGLESVENPFKLQVAMNLTNAPNVASTLWVSNLPANRGSLYDPLLTMWQQSSYTMTPNNSGYNTYMAQSLQTIKNGITPVLLLGGAAIIAATVLTGGAAGVAAAGGMGLASTLGLSAGMSAVNTASQAVQQQNTAERLEVMGLPKANGGTSDGMTRYTLNNAGYKFYLVHLRTDLLRNVDYFFSLFGYTQNKVRYPHINIRKRWSYVKCKNVNIVPNLSVNNYPAGGIPTEAYNQIVQRMTGGITFWNIRHAIMGDGDTGPCNAVSWEDMSDIIHCRYVKNYGAGPDSDVVKENASFTGGYANDYTDDYSYQEGTV